MNISPSSPFSHSCWRLFHLSSPACGGGETRKTDDWCKESIERDLLDAIQSCKTTELDQQWSVGSIWSRGATRRASNCFATSDIISFHPHHPCTTSKLCRDRHRSDSDDRDTLPLKRDSLSVSARSWRNIPKTRDMKVRQFRQGQYPDDNDATRANVFEQRDGTMGSDRTGVTSVSDCRRPNN